MSRFDHAHNVRDRALRAHEFDLGVLTTVGRIRRDWKLTFRYERTVLVVRLALDLIVFFNRIVRWNFWTRFP